MTWGEPWARPAFFFRAGPVRISRICPIFFTGSSIAQSRRAVDNAVVNINRDQESEREARIDALVEAIRTRAARRSQDAEPAPHQIGLPFAPAEAPCDGQSADAAQPSATKGMAADDGIGSRGSLFLAGPSPQDSPDDQHERDGHGD